MDCEKKINIFDNMKNSINPIYNLNFIINSPKLLTYDSNKISDHFKLHFLEDFFLNSFEWFI